jgi:ubiquinone/menaquinone biosynthesis C-methylase UbiE
MKEHIAKKRVAKRYFDKWALDYDNSILQHIVFKTSHEMLIKEILVNNGGKKKVLDVGCGTGEFVYKLAEYFKKYEVHGIDLSKEMINKASNKSGFENAKFEIGDVENMPYPDNTYDIITCSHSFHHYPNKDKAMAEMYRILKPNGRVMIVDGCRDVFFGRVIFDIVERMEKHVYHLFAEEFRKLFRDTGFNNIVQKRFNFVPLLLSIGTAIKEKKEEKNNVPGNAS